MGIKHLHQFLRKTCPQVYVEIPLSKYAFRKIAIDISIYMCKFKTSYGVHYMDAFLKLISVLRYNDIHFVCVYDTKAPPEKSLERKLRLESRERSKLRVETIRESWDFLVPFWTTDFSSYSEWIQSMKQSYSGHGLFYKFVDQLSTECRINDVSLEANMIEHEILRLENTLLSVKSEDFLLTKEFFKVCNIPYLDAEGEAEATCASLAKQGFVSAVLTEDTDVLAYGCPFMLHKLDFESNSCMEIDLDEILNALHFTYSQWLDFCIMCGTDYNSNLPRIGSEKAFKLIQQFGSLDHFPFSVDVSGLNHKRVRELFLHPISFSSVSIPYCGFPDYLSLQELAFVHNCRFDLKHFHNTFSTSIFHQFPSESEESSEPSASVVQSTPSLLLRMS